MHHVAQGDISLCKFSSIASIWVICARVHVHIADAHSRCPEQQRVCRERECKIALRQLYYHGEEIRRHGHEGVVQNIKNKKKLVVANGQSFMSRYHGRTLPGRGSRHVLVKQEETIHFAILPTPHTVCCEYWHQQTHRHEQTVGCSQSHARRDAALSDDGWDEKNGSAYDGGDDAIDEEKHADACEVLDMTE